VEFSFFLPPSLPYYVATGCSESPKTLGKQVVTQLFVIVHTSG
jgi:hypothetical protein